MDSAHIDSILHYRPYPNLEFQKVGDCNAIQFVQGMQIEPNGVMWLPGREKFVLRKQVRMNH